LVADLRKLVFESESHLPRESTADVCGRCKNTKDHYIHEFAVFDRYSRSALQYYADCILCLMEIEIHQCWRGVNESRQRRVFKPMRLMSELFSQPADSFLPLLAPPILPSFVERLVSSAALNDLLSLHLYFRISVFRQVAHDSPSVSLVVFQEESRCFVAASHYPANLVFRLS
jgi:hypothetical protein